MLEQKHQKQASKIRFINCVYGINYNCNLYLNMCLYITLMETFKRKCACCNKTTELSKYLGDHKTCIIC